MIKETSRKFRYKLLSRKLSYISHASATANQGRSHQQVVSLATQLSQITDSAYGIVMHSMATEFNLFAYELSVVYSLCLHRTQMLQTERYIGNVRIDALVRPYVQNIHMYNMGLSLYHLLTENTN